jgi:hypothetical protein
VETRTSGAKALIGVVFYGTAEAVPFVQSVFPQPVQSGPDTKLTAVTPKRSKLLIWTGVLAPPITIQSLFE